MLKHINHSLRSWRDFARECFCFGSETVNASGEAVRGLVKSGVEFGISLAASPLANSSRAKPARKYGGSAVARPLTHPASYAGYINHCVSLRVSFPPGWWVSEQVRKNLSCGSRDRILSLIPMSFSAWWLWTSVLRNWLFHDRSYPRIILYALKWQHWISIRRKFWSRRGFISDSGTRELTLKCKLKCYFKPMNNPLGVSPSKGKQGTTRGKEKIFWPRWKSNPRPTD